MIENDFTQLVCEDCNAGPGEPCRPYCTGKASYDEIEAKVFMKTNLDTQAKRIVKLIEILNGLDVTENEARSEAKFRIAARMSLIERELERIGEFIDPGWRGRQA